MGTLAGNVVGIHAVGAIIGGVGPTFTGKGITSVVRVAAGRLLVTLTEAINLLPGPTCEGVILCTVLRAGPAPGAVGYAIAVPLTTTTFEINTFDAVVVAAGDTNVTFVVQRYAPP